MSINFDYILSIVLRGQTIYLWSVFSTTTFFLGFNVHVDADQPSLYLQCLPRCHLIKKNHCMLCY